MAAVLAGKQQQARSIFSEKREFPEIVLLKIFSNLSIHDLGKACLVCKQWNSVISGSNVVWKRFVPKWPWFEPPTGAQGAYQIVKKLWKKECATLGNERWLPDPIPELVKYNKYLTKAECKYYNFYGDISLHSSVTLIARLNPCYEFTTKGDDSDDETMNEICEEIWKNFGEKDEYPFEVTSHHDLMRQAAFQSRKMTLEEILINLEPPWFLGALELEPYTLDEEGEIIGGGGEIQGTGDVPDVDKHGLGEDISVSRYERVFDTPWKARINKRLPVELYRKIKAFFADGSDRFIEYYLSDGCYSENPMNGYFLLISDTAVLHIKQFYDL